MFTRNAALLATSMPQEAVKRLIVPLLVRAADQGSSHLLIVSGQAVASLLILTAQAELHAQIVIRSSNVASVTPPKVFQLPNATCLQVMRRRRRRWSRRCRCWQISWPTRT